MVIRRITAKQIVIIPARISLFAFTRRVFSWDNTAHFAANPVTVVGIKNQIAKNLNQHPSLFDNAPLHPRIVYAFE